MNEPPTGGPESTVPSASEVELAAARRHLRVISTVAVALARTSTPREVFHELTRVARDLLGASGITMYEVEAASGDVTVVFVGGDDAPKVVPTIQRGMDSAALRALLRSGIEGFFGDPGAQEASQLWEAVGTPRPEEMLSFARLPLYEGSTVAGVLTVRWPTTRLFDPAERALLRDLAMQAALALRNANLLERERQQRHRAVAAAMIARSAAEAQSGVAAVEGALTALAQAAHAGGYAIGVVDSERRNLRYLGATGVLASLVGLEIPLGASTLGSASAAGAECAHLPTEAQHFPLRVHDHDVGILWVAPERMGEMPVAPVATIEALLPGLALATDVARFRDAETLRRRRERMLATALDTMEQAVVLVALDRRILYANPAALRLFGYAAQEFEGALLDQLVTTIQGPRRTGVPHPPDGGSILLGEQPQRRKDGTTFPASVHLSFIRDAQDSPVGQIVVIRDLTDERLRAEQMRQSEKLAALGELVAGVAHELNNPLAGISAFAQLLLEEPLDAEQMESVRLIRREADRAVAVIRDLLLFSRKSGPSRTSVDLNELVGHTLRLRNYGLRSSGIEVQLALAPDLPAVAGDPQRLQQVVLNLMVNAEHAMQGAERRQLTVETARAPGLVLLSIADTGPGIDEATRHRIFEPFFTTKPVGEGTGLGLSVSYGIVRAHGGEIQVESLPGGGTTFRVSLPVESAMDAIVA